MMPMILTNGRTAPRPTLQIAQKSIAQIPVTKSLNSSMIARIHNAKPGCGSCGRH
jgi:hypothetical protein